jgi:hypothetical protein
MVGVGWVFSVLSGDDMGEQKQEELCADYTENQSRKSEIMQRLDA